eukprot:353320-Chlamydomonas_euryale.AAC.1
MLEVQRRHTSEHDCTAAAAATASVAAACAFRGLSESVGGCCHTGPPRRRQLLRRGMLPFEVPPHPLYQRPMQLQRRAAAAAARGGWCSSGSRCGATAAAGASTGCLHRPYGVKRAGVLGARHLHAADTLRGKHACTSRVQNDQRACCRFMVVAEVQL